jgi:hypothetical protein
MPGDASACWLPKGGTKRLKIRLQEADVPSHDAEMRNLPSLNPQVHRLRADPEVHRRVADGEWKFFWRDRQVPCASARGIDLEVLWIHAYL